MNTFDYTLVTEQNTLTQTASTIYQSVTGTNNITFSLSGIDQSESPVDKVIVTFYDDRELVFNRSFTDSLSSLSAVTFTQAIESEVIDQCSKPVLFALHRDDGITDFFNLVFYVYSGRVSDYEDINLIKSDFIKAGTNDKYGDTLIHTFETSEPKMAGMNILTLDSDEYDFFNGYSDFIALTGESTQVGFTGYPDEYAIVNSYANAGGGVNIPGIFNVLRSGSTSNPFSVKFRTRQPLANASLNIGLGTQPFIPAIPGTQFLHTSGYLNWNCNELDSIKSINVPIIDVVGVDIRDGYVPVFKLAGTGIGTSMAPVSGGYFFVDLFDVESCSENVNLATSTLTAYITY